MDVTYRIESEEPESVAETEVIRYWLRKEIEEDTEDNLDPDTLDDRKELLDALVDRKPLAESIFGEADRNWYRLVLSEHELRGLEVVRGPENEGWRAVAKGGLIESIAERILAADNLDAFDNEVPKNLTKVADFADNVSSETELEELIVVGDENGRPYIADGNHRAVGMALHILQSGEYIEQQAYVGVDRQRINLQ
ncbi:hypothetical protein [Halococcus sediminicola]|uniref:hypothetical protein n=1 Tax=Halococcus sediminicola TaxID=1264579 RepID=UPI0006792E44|nr:hypothetical protein [Halococcus sediminicola]